MADDKTTDGKSEKERTLEMRVAELEDKLSGMQVTEEEMKAFNKVSAMLGGGATRAAEASASSPVGLTPVPDFCVIRQCSIVNPCTIIRQCTVINQCSVINPCSIQACTVQQCIQQCINECAGGAPGGGFGNGGFGGLGG